jgi:hypothetical protein
MLRTYSNPDPHGLPAFWSKIHGSFGYDLKNGGPVLQQVWHVKKPSLIKAIYSAKQSSVIGNSESRQIAEVLLMRPRTNKQRKKCTASNINFNVYKCTLSFVRIRVRIGPPHPHACRKRRLNGAVPSNETGETEVPCHSRSLPAQRSWAPSIGL